MDPGGSVLSGICQVLWDQQAPAPCTCQSSQWSSSVTCRNCRYYHIHTFNARLAFILDDIAISIIEHDTLDLAFGVSVGEAEGDSLREADGEAVGVFVGDSLGLAEGGALGLAEGDALGLATRWGLQRALLKEKL